MLTRQPEFETLQDRSKLEACYQSQIDALLADKYGALCDLIGAYRWMPSHAKCWNRTAYYRLSIFANLPSCERCASQIQSYNPLHPEAPDRHLNHKLHELMRDIVLDSSTMILPTPDEEETDEDEDNPFRFTEGELREFMRRQVVARFNEDGTPRKIYVPE